MNCLQPNSISNIYTGSIAYKTMENTNNYLSACVKMGIPAPELFETADLVNERNPSLVSPTLSP